MTRPPLNAATLEILRLIRAGESTDRIVELGWWRRSWTRQDVAAVARHWLARDTDSADGSKPVPAKPTDPIEHGSYAAYQRCRKANGKACPACVSGKRAHQQRYRNQGKNDPAHALPLARVTDPEAVAMSYGQLRVLGALCKGLTNPEIAATLKVSESTVKAHLKPIYRALGVSTRTHAIEQVVSGAVRLRPGRRAS